MHESEYLTITLNMVRLATTTHYLIIKTYPLLLLLLLSRLRSYSSLFISSLLQHTKVKFISIYSCAALVGAGK